MADYNPSQAASHGHTYGVGSQWRVSDSWVWFRSHTANNYRSVAGFRFDIPDSVDPATVTGCTLKVNAANAGSGFETLITAVPRATDFANTSTNRPNDVWSTTHGTVAFDSLSGPAVNDEFTSDDFSSVMESCLDATTASGGYYEIAVLVEATGAATTYANQIQGDVTSPTYPIVLSLEITAGAGVTTTAPVVTLTVPAVTVATTFDADVTTTAASVTATAQASGSGPSAVVTAAPTVSATCGTVQISTDNLVANDSTNSIHWRSYTIWWPTTAAPAGGHPVVAYVHGGRWQAGGRTPSSSDENYLDPDWRDACLDAGLAVMSIDYRLTAQDAVLQTQVRTTQPLPIKDVKTAILHLQNAASSATTGDDTLPLNGETMVIAGHSAGAHLALWTVATTDDTAAYLTGRENAATLGTWGDGRNGYQATSWSATYQYTYEYTFAPWGDGVVASGGTAPDDANNTHTEITPMAGAFLYAPIWDIWGAQTWSSDSVVDTANIWAVRTIYGLHASALGGGTNPLTVEGQRYEGDIEDYIQATATETVPGTYDSTHYNTRLSTTARTLPALGVAYSDDDLLIGPVAGFTPMSAFYTAQGADVGTTQTMSSAGEVVLSAGEVEKTGLTAIKLPSGTDHPDVLFDSSPADFLTWRAAVLATDGAATTVAPLVAVTVPAPAISYDAGVTVSAASVTVAGGVAAGGVLVNATAASVSVAPGASAGSTTGEETEPASVLTTFTPGAATVSVDAMTTTTAPVASLTAGTVGITADADLTTTAPSATVTVPAAVVTYTGAATTTAAATTVGCGTATVTVGADITLTAAAVTLAPGTTSTEVSGGATVTAIAVSVAAGVSTGTGTGSAAADAVPVTVGAGTVAITTTRDVTTTAPAVTVGAGTVTASAGGDVDATAVATTVTVPTPGVQISGGSEATPAATVLSIGAGTVTITVDANVVLAAAVLVARCGSVGVSTGGTALRIRNTKRRPDYSHTGRRPDWSHTQRRDST